MEIRINGFGQQVRYDQTSSRWVPIESVVRASKVGSKHNIAKVKPKVITEHGDAVLVECLNEYSVWALKKDKSVTPCLIRDGYWEADITAWFVKNIEPDWTVVDVGANCGYFTVLFEQLVGEYGDVLAFEANPEYVRLLNLTKEVNEASYGVFGAALGDAVSTATLVIPGDYTGSASTIVESFDAKWGTQTQIEVPQSTLDEELRGCYVDLIKIDAESSEERILAGANETLASKPILVLEYTPGAYSNKFNDRLFEYGDVSFIGMGGSEHKIDKKSLDGLKDWKMVVVRP